MTPEVIHLFALVGLRALADYDPTEFRRTSDLSKRQVDERIELLLKTARDDRDQILATEVSARLKELYEIERDAEGQAELAFLLRQLGLSCLQRAQQLALSYSRTSGPRTREPKVPVQPAASPVFHRGPEEHLRLGVMRLIRELPGYVPSFEFPTRGQTVDCMLEPPDTSLPVVFIEGKRSLRSMGSANGAATQIRRATRGWGRRAIAAVLVAEVTLEVRRRWNSDIEGVFLLVYDGETNDFSHGASELVALIQSWAAYET
jgi:hypothetical protein